MPDQRREVTGEQLYAIVRLTVERPKLTLSEAADRVLPKRRELGPLFEPEQEETKA